MKQKEKSLLKKMNSLFPILAVETSSELCSTALMADENVVSEINLKKKHVHSQMLLPMIQHVLDSLNIDLKDLSSIAVSIGPGSFTGLRIGLAAVKGIAVGANLPIIPVPTLEALALSLCRYLPEGTRFSIANSVNTEELYFAKFQKFGGGYKILKEIHLIKKEELEKNLAADELLFGDYSDSKIGCATAEQTANWAYLFGKDLLTFDYDYLEPYYLKKFVTKVKL